jgi:phage tail sheath protein FI
VPVDFIHGLEFVEIKTKKRPIRVVTTAVWGLVGIAPEFDAIAPNTNKLDLIDSDVEAEEKYGDPNILYALSGTVSTTKDSNSVTGTSTKFLSELGEGEAFKVGSEVHIVKSITSDTALLTEKIFTTTNSNVPAFKEGWTITSALRRLFATSLGQALVVNVFDPNNTNHFVAEAEKSYTVPSTLKVQLDYPVVLKTSPATLVVKVGTVVQVEGTDYTVDYRKGILTMITVASGATILVSYRRAKPSGVTSSEIIGTVSGGVRTGLKKLLDSYSQFGLNPKLILCPGAHGEGSTTAGVAREMESIAGKTRALCFEDHPKGTKNPDTVISNRNASNHTFNTSNGRGLLCYPHIKTFSTGLNSATLEPHSQNLAAVAVKTDFEQGYWKSFSNKQLDAAIGMEFPLTASLSDPTTDVQKLNKNGIWTVLSIPNSGYRSFGNRTAAYPTDTDPITYAKMRRIADVLHESIELSFLPFLDEDIDDALISGVVESVNQFMSTLIGRGALLVGSKCVFNPKKNPTTEIAKGHLTFDLIFMGKTPAETYTFESFIDIDLLKATLPAT